MVKMIGSSFRQQGAILALLIVQLTPSNGIRIGSSFVVRSRHKYSSCLWMGLYDSPLPPPPPDDFADKKRKISKRFVENNVDGDDTNDDGDSDFTTSSSILFNFHENGVEASGILPSLGRNPSLVPCFYEPEDNVVRSVVRMTRCHPQDACWALEACKGNIMEASVAIALAQRNALNSQVALPSDFKDVDWDEELKQLMSIKNNDKQSPQTRSVEDWQNFEQEGYSIGFDGGLRERTEALKRREQLNNVKRMLEPGKPDEDWLPGSPNSKPLDDEPWFTG